MSVKSATVSSVAASATSVALFAAVEKNAADLRTIYNDSTAVLYVKFGSTASATSFTVKLGPGDYYEFPTPLYTGVVHGIWASATGSARLTEAV